MAAIGVALSGGGYRATAWSLGALIYLVDARKNAEVASISSVSGGSIANGIIAHRLDFSAVDADGFAESIKPALRHIAYEGLFPGPSTNLYLAAVAALAGATALALAFLVIAGALTMMGLVTLGWARWVGLGIVIAVPVLVLLFAKRSEIVDRALGKVHFSGGGTHGTLLREVGRDVGHVFCATELQAGDHLYFSPDFIYSYRFGIGRPGDLPLSTAVQCSACLPAAFRPRRLSTKPHAFAPHLRVDPPSEPPRAMVLSDGGVYDNMADQWHQGFEDRARRWEELRQRHREVDELIVVNASGGWQWNPLRGGVIGDELAGLKRSSSIMYDVTTSHRRKGLIGRFDEAAVTGEGMIGALVHIPQSPFKVADAYRGADAKWPERASRARAVLDKLGDDDATREQWNAIAHTSAEVGTVLSKLGRETTAGLLQHAYVLAMCNLHVILGYPLGEIPARERFEALLD